MSKAPLIDLSNENPIMSYIAIIAGYVVKYIAYGFLTPVVLLTFAALIFDYITIAGSEMPFLKYFAFTVPANSGGTTHLNADDIMKGYGSITTVLFLLSIIGSLLSRMSRYIKKRIFHPNDKEETNEGNASSEQKPPFGIRRRLIISSIVITTTYATLFIVLPFAPMSKGTSFLTGYVIFIIFYLIALISNSIYIGIDSLSNKLIGWAASNIK
jgi:hypothetical protein